MVTQLQSAAAANASSRLVVVFLLLLLCQCLHAQCPSECDCLDTSVFCSSKQLTEIPLGISESTTYLYVLPLLVSVRAYAGGELEVSYVDSLVAMTPCCFI